MSTYGLLNKLYTLADLQRYGVKFEEPPVRRIDGSPNEDWLSFQSAVEDKFVPEEALTLAIAEEDRIIDEMIGLRSPPQYPHPEDAERVFPSPPGGQYYRDAIKSSWRNRQDLLFQWG